MSEGTYDEAEGMASRLEAIGLYEDKVESLKEQLSSLGGIADDVNTLITRWITLREQRQNQVKSLRSLSEELIALDVSGVEPLEAGSLQNPLAASRAEHGSKRPLWPACDLRDVRMGTQHPGRSVTCPAFPTYLWDGGNSQPPV